MVVVVVAAAYPSPWSCELRLVVDDSHYRELVVVVVVVVIVVQTNLCLQ